MPYTVATGMDTPNPDSGEEYPHTNTQLYNILNEQNRFKVQDDISAPYNAPAPGQAQTMDGFVTDYISNFVGEMGRQPTYEEDLPDHDGVHPRAGTGAERPRPWVRGVRPLVLRGPVPDAAQPVVLDRGHVLGLRVEPARVEVLQEQRRRDDLQPARRPRQDLEDLRQRAASGSRSFTRSSTSHGSRTGSRRRSCRSRSSRPTPPMAICPTSRSSSRAS